MITALKHFLALILLPGLYFGGIVALFISVFKRANYGLLLIIILIPQPNVWHKLRDYPLGKDFIDLLFFSVLIGLFVQKKVKLGKSNMPVVLMFILTSYLALINCSMHFSLPFPVSTSNFLLFDWKNYAEMILLYFLALNLLKNEKDQKVAVVLIALTILFISLRSYRNFTGGESFSYDKRVGGPFESVGLGANHFGAFIADYCAVLLGLFLLDKNKWRRLLYISAVLFGLHPLFYSYSRGAYLAFFAAVTLFGVVKKRSLLVVVVVVFVAWQTILPASVVDRIQMTETQSGEIEGSAAHRFVLWEHAMSLFRENPVFGVGFGGFGFTVPEGELTDTHNFYVKTLSEQGIIGITFLGALLLMALRSGVKLYRKNVSSFHNGLALGFLGCLLALIITNIFGDRWSYFTLGGYFWIFWGIVDAALRMAPKEDEQEAVSVDAAAGKIILPPFALTRKNLKA